MDMIFKKGTSNGRRHCNTISDIENRCRNVEEFVELVKLYIVTIDEEAIYNEMKAILIWNYIVDGRCLLLEQKRSRLLFSLHPL